jgi:uroporphyrin-III C-methyltransferase
VTAGQATGKVYLVGAGPGAADLLTIRALRLLEAADVVLHDRLVGPDILAYAGPQVELVNVGKREGQQEQVQQQILDLLIMYARQGKQVVRLKGGDPMVFGRGGEEWQVLRDHGIPVELVPGVSSAIALPGLAGIPLTFRGVSRAFTVVTGHGRDGQTPDWNRYVRVETLIILMGAQRRVAIARALIAAGRDANEPVAFIERGGMPDERTVATTLQAIADGAVTVQAPAVMVVGPVVNIRDRLLPVSGALIETS